MAVLRGGEDVCTQAGIPVAGGHSIDSVRRSTVSPLAWSIRKRIKRNAGARADDVLVFNRSARRGRAVGGPEEPARAGYAEMIANTTKLNRPDRSRRRACMH